MIGITVNRLKALAMDAMSELVKVENVNQDSSDLDLILPAEQKTDSEDKSTLVGSNTESGLLNSKHQDSTLSIPITDQPISENMDITGENPTNSEDTNVSQEMSTFPGVDIITLQNSANSQPLFQLVSSGDGTSYIQLSDTQLIQTVTSIDQGLQTVTLPTGVTALIQQPDKQEGQAIQLEDGTTAIIRNIQPVKDQGMTAKLLEGQFIHLDDGTTGFIQPSLGSADMQSVQLEDGSTAYISLFGDASGGALSIDNNTSQELQTPLRVIAGSDETENQVAVAEEENMTSMSNVKQESTLSESVVATESQVVVNSEEESVTTNTVSQPHLSYRALALGDKAYKCSYQGCGRLYTTQHHLRVHGRSHTGDKPFKCEFPGCGKAFPSGYGLKSHTRVHTGEKPYRCTEENCTKAFKTSGDLQKHIRTHTGERPFKCPFEGCNRMFTTSNIRKVHIRTHTGERPYVCEEEGCHKSFASATNYKNHMRIHTGEKPYVCTVEGCGKRFTEYSSLYKHHIVHTQSKPYVCNHCHKTYRQTSTLAMHKRTVHNDDTSYEGTSLINTIPAVQIVNQVPGTTTDRESADTEGTLVINTSESSLTLPQGSSTLLQHLQPTGISVQGSGVQQVYLIADPNQIETLKQIASQQQTVSDGQVKKIDDQLTEPPSTNTEAMSTCGETGPDQLLEGANSVLSVENIDTSQTDENLVSYTE